MQTHWDVVVAGGGPAGLSLAACVASRGCSVVVAERMPSIAERVRTSGGTLVSAMREAGIPPALYHELDELCFQTPCNRASFPLRQPRLCVLDVRGAYRFLAEQAVRAGASVLTSATIDRPLRDARGRVTGCRLGVKGSPPEELSCRMLVDATGYVSALAREAGLHEGFRRFGVGAELEMTAPNADPGLAMVLLGERWAPAGYAWAFPCPGGRVRVGSGVLHTDSRAEPRLLLDPLRRDLARLGVDLSGGEVVEAHHGLIPSDGLPRRFTAPGMVAVGDAAGQPTLVVGEGIRVALLAGRMAGEAVAAALAEPAREAHHLRGYERRFRALFARDLAIGLAVNRVMARWDDGDRARVVDTIRGMPPAVAVRLLLSRFLDPAVIGWVAAHPRSWKTLGRALLKRRAAAPEPVVSTV